MGNRKVAGQHLRLTGLLSVFSSHPTLIHAVIDLLALIDHSSTAGEQRRA